MKVIIFIRCLTACISAQMTLFSVGYGDMYPVGIGKLFATFEAFIGYIMPAIFVMRTVTRT